MRVTALILAIALGLVISTGRADAEKVRTNQSTKLHSRPGEQSKVLLTVKSGQNMTLLGQDGRWLKVRVKGRTGYVPRSKVDMADDGEIARNTRRRPFVDGRSKRRGFGGDAGPDDRIGADAVGEGQEGGDEEEVEEDPKPKKVAKKGGDDEDEEEAPRPKKAVAKPGGGDEEEDDEEPAPKKASKGGDEEEDEEEEEDAPRKGGDEEDEEEATDDEEAEESRPIARVGKQVSVYEEPDADSDEQFVVRPSDILYPMDKKGKWTFVENAEGDGGWVETEYLELGEEGGGGPRKRTIELRARAGLTFIQQGMRTQGSTNTTVPDNYNIGTSSVTLSVGGGILMPVGKKYVIGGEVTYDFAKTLFGGVFYDPDRAEGPMPGVNIGVTIHNINVRGIAGIDLKKRSGMMVMGRLGYRYQSFLVADYADPAKNPAKLPQEVVKAPTLGAAFAIPRLTGKIGLRFSLDAILLGASVKQTEGLEDGTDPSVMAVAAGAGVNYKWKNGFDLQATYDLNYMGIDFGMPPATSTRGHMGSSVSRTDFFHMVTFGVARPF